MTRSPKSAKKKSLSPLHPEWRAKHRATVENLKLRLQADKFMKIVDETRKTTPLRRFSRLVGVINLEDFNSRVRDALLDLTKRADPHAGWQNETFDPNDYRVFFLYADNFITLKEHTPSDFPIVEAFKKAGLDSNNPAHWRVLMMLLCWSLFPPEGRPGRPSDWTDAKYCQLL